MDRQTIIESRGEVGTGAVMRWIRNLRATKAAEPGMRSSPSFPSATVPRVLRNEGDSGDDGHGRNDPLWLSIPSTGPTGPYGRREPTRGNEPTRAGARHTAHDRGPDTGHVTRDA